MTGHFVPIRVCLVLMTDLSLDEQSCNVDTDVWLFELTLSVTWLCLLSKAVAWCTCAVAPCGLANVQTCPDNTSTLIFFHNFSKSHPQQTNTVIATIFREY